MFGVESNHTLAEKQRLNSIEHEAPVSSNKRERSGCLLAFDWILRPWHYFNTIPRAVAYLVAGSGFYGGILFVIGSFAGCSPAVNIVVCYRSSSARWSCTDRRERVYAGS